MFTFRSGDPQRGLRYLNRAHDSGCEDEDLFVIRCQCHLRLGNFGLADKVYTYHIIFSICRIIIMLLVFISEWSKAIVSQIINRMPM